MTKGEREQLRGALRDILSDGKFTDGVAALSKLAGMRYPAGELKGLRRVSPVEIASRPNQTFRVKRSSKHDRPSATVLVALALATLYVLVVWSQR